MKSVFALIIQLPIRQSSLILHVCVPLLLLLPTQILSVRISRDRNESRETEVGTDRFLSRRDNGQKSAFGYIDSSISGFSIEYFRYQYLGILGTKKETHLKVR